MLAPRSDDQRGGKQIVITAVGTRADHRLVEGDALAGNFYRRKRVPGTEWLRDHRDDVPELQRLVELVGRIGSGPKPRIGQLGHAVGAVPLVGDVVWSKDAVL